MPHFGLAPGDVERKQTLSLLSRGSKTSEEENSSLVLR